MEMKMVTICCFDCIYISPRPVYSAVCTFCICSVVVLLLEFCNFLLCLIQSSALFYRLLFARNFWFTLFLNCVYVQKSH